MLDDLVALIHAELDQIAPAGRANEVETRDARLMVLAEDRPRVLACSAIGDADRFEELARRVGAEFEEDQLRRDTRDVAANGEVRIALIDLLHAGAEVDGHLSRSLPAQHFLDQYVVGAGDLRAADDEADTILVGERDGDLQRGITGTDHEEILIAMLGRIDEAVADVRQIFARHAQLARVALGSHRQDDIAGVELVALRCLDLEPAAFFLH